ncbi:ferrochelatase [Roseateles sp. BYS180W]|uniref:Ferrochelatase n=1 Tax=Roseateles rivi TaxID=3299028 RepID=A0ABW7FVM9_9BURK
MHPHPKSDLAPSAAGKTAILLCNLGTPEAPTAAALRRYLSQFLSDPRVVELPRLLWWPILHGVVLRVRPAKSAAKYATVWTSEGSPLAVWTQRQAKLLQGYLGERGHAVVVRHAMRYGQPSIGAQLDALKAEGAQRILILPAYPQYCAATTASVMDDLAHWTLRTRALPELRAVRGYHDDPAYIQALAASVRKHWADNGRPELLVMSFHGMPARTRERGDPYHDECQRTGALLAQALGLSEQDYVVTFQSRFGKARWLEPYTEPTLKARAAAGVKKVDVICPGFSSDCLETLEEIAQEAREAFLHAGGQAFSYIPCLNADDAHIKALTQLALRHLQGWPTTPAA